LRCKTAFRLDPIRIAPSTGQCGSNKTCSCALVIEHVFVPRGAGDNVQLAATFRSAFYACLVVSAITATVGHLNIETVLFAMGSCFVTGRLTSFGSQFASLCNASPAVADAIVSNVSTCYLGFQVLKSCYMHVDPILWHAANVRSGLFDAASSRWFLQVVWRHIDPVATRSILFDSQYVIKLRNDRTVELGKATAS
jgi:hypothetical protein